PSPELRPHVARPSPRPPQRRRGPGPSPRPPKPLPKRPRRASATTPGERPSTTPSRGCAGCSPRLAAPSRVATLPAAPDDWHRAVVARARVLVEGESAVDELLSALDAGALAPTPIEEARAQLVAGSALRRRRRPAASQD